MRDPRFAGLLIRALRLERNWSQETLSHGICAVSYLSKIEQGKADANPQLLADLFARLQINWADSAELDKLRDELYESIFSWNDKEIIPLRKKLEENWDLLRTSHNYADFLVIRAYLNRMPELVPHELIALLDSRQKALVAISKDSDEEAYSLCPCPLTAFCVAEKAYTRGNYTLALEYFQVTCDQAAREGYVYIQMYAQSYMANCYADMGNLDAMRQHSRIAERLGMALEEKGIVETVRYNLAATMVEFGDYEAGYSYFCNVASPGIMDLHKLAICCEALGRCAEAMEALEQASQLQPRIPLEAELCDVVRYRLEHPDYLHDEEYGALLMNTFEKVRKELHFGYARFHLRWVCQWLTANRQYRKAFEILKSFPECRVLDGV